MQVIEVKLYQKKAQTPEILTDTPKDGTVRQILAPLHTRAHVAKPLH